ncbi:MAG: TadE/TadG family type IV pilus assembly protein, partial [Amphiplicatus sp.]
MNGRSVGGARGGNVAIVTAILLPVVMLAAGGAVDFQRIGLQHAKLQEFSDMLALRGAREFLLANARPSEIESMIRAISKSGLPDDLAMAPLDVSVRADAKEQAVTVTLTQPA